jgi:hypothetical protein
MYGYAVLTLGRQRGGAPVRKSASGRLTVSVTAWILFFGHTMQENSMTELLDFIVDTSLAY